MKPIQLLYIQSETGRHRGIIMSVEDAKLIAKRKPPPEGREGAADRFIVSGHTNNRSTNKTPHIGD